MSDHDKTQNILELDCGVPPSEVTRLPPLRGAARFYHSAAPSGDIKVGW